LFLEGEMDTLAETDAFSEFHPNACCVCQKPARGSTGGVPNYLCGSCWVEWGAAFVKREEWIYWLYRQEHARRKRRTRRTKAGAPFVNSLDAMLSAQRKAVAGVMG
jgi:hypothetical protein